MLFLEYENVVLCFLFMDSFYCGYSRCEWKWFFEEFFRFIGDYILYWRGEF